MKGDMIMIQEYYIMLMVFLPIGLMVSLNLLITLTFKECDKEAVLVIRWLSVLSAFILCYFSVFITFLLLISLVFVTAFLEYRKSGKENVLVEFSKYIRVRLNKKDAVSEVPVTAELEN